MGLRRMDVQPSATVMILLLTFFLRAEGISLGFSQRSQTVSEADGVFESNLNIRVHAMNFSKLMGEFEVRVLENRSTATVYGRVNQASPLSNIDAIFGTDETQESHDLSLGRDFIGVIIVNDFIPEEMECFTLQITPPDTLTCNQDEDNATDYFCLHTVCIEDDDTNAPFTIGFEESIYEVREGDSANVCFLFLTPPNPPSSTFNEVYVDIFVPMVAHHLPTADIEIDYISHFNMSIPLTDSTRKLCFDVVATDDMELELSEFASFFLLIEYGINITVERSMTTITILDNDRAIIGLEQSYESDEEVDICVLVLEPVTDLFKMQPIAFVLNLVLTVQTPLNPDNSYNEKNLILEAGQTRVCTTVCGVVEMNDTFEVGLSRTAGLDSRVQFAPSSSVITVNNTLGKDVAVAWEKSSYTVDNDASDVSVCVVVYSTTSFRNVTLTVQVLSVEDDTTLPPVSLMSALGERQCIAVDVLEGFCRNFSLKISSDDHVCILVETTNINIDMNNTLCSPMLVGYEMSEYKTPAKTEREVELCAVVAGGSAVRPFTLQAYPPSGSRVKFQLIGNGELIFETNDSRQCYNISVTISPDEICDDFSMEMLTPLLELLSGIGDISVLPSSTQLFIVDSKEPECAPILVGYDLTSYIVSEGLEAKVCVEVTSHPNGAPRPFSLTVMTMDATAVSDVDFVPLSENISVPAGDTRDCIIIFTLRDEECEYSECSYEHFLCNLTTLNYHVNLEPSQTTIFIEEDLISQNCSYLLGDTNCTETSHSPTSTMPLSTFTAATPTPTLFMNNSENNTSSLLYVYILVPIGLLLISVVIVFVLVILCSLRRRKHMAISLPEHRSIKSGSPKRFDASSQQHADSILLQIRQKVPKEMVYTKDRIHLSSIVGQGESGLVYKALLETRDGRELVAVKTVKALFASSDVAKLIKEISIMLSFSHPNVMTMRGVCVDHECPLLIMQFMSNGSVLEYVKHQKEDLLLVNEANTMQISSARKLMLGMCHQIAKGMEYLAGERFVHRDLAARNCMIDMHGVIKVADFGLTEDVYASNYYRKDVSETGNDEKVPIRWMAPESIKYDLYTEKTDVWSFGVTCWEVFTCGQIPYHGISVLSLLNALSNGERLNKPQNFACTEKIYAMLHLCWNESSEQRPTFLDLVQQISTTLEEEAGYLDFSRSLSWKNQEQGEYSQSPSGKQKSSGNTSVMASLNGHNVVNALINSGADMNLALKCMSIIGTRPFDVARSQGHFNIVHTLNKNNITTLL